MKTILITGATGFLGSRLVERLTTTEINVLVLKRMSSKIDFTKSYRKHINVFDIETVDLKSLFMSYKIDTIVHAATCYGRNGESKSQIVDTNLKLPLMLVDLASLYRVPIFLNIDTSLDRRINEYALSKKQFKEWLNLFKKKMCVINMVLEHFYGPGGKPNNFVTWLIRKMLHHEPIDLTAGEQIRYFVYIDDVVNAICQAMKHHQKDTIGAFEYHIGGFERTSIRNLAQIAYKYTRSNSILNFGAIGYRADEIMETPIIPPESTDVLDWIPKISLREGLSITVDYEKRRMAAYSSIEK